MGNVSEVDSLGGLQIPAIWQNAEIACGALRNLVQVVWKFLRTVKTEAAFSATVGTNGNEKQNPIFQKSAAFGAMYVHAAATRTRSFRLVDIQSEDSSHVNRIISRTLSGCNRGGID